MLGILVRSPILQQLTASCVQILYEKLFESDAAGDQCKFAETVREQSLLEYNELISDLQISMVHVLPSHVFL